MAFSKTLAARTRQAFEGCKGIAERKMFGGLIFLWRGNICVGVSGDALIVRLAPHETEQLLRSSYVRPFAPTGRSMKGWILVDAEGLDTDRQLREWIEQALQFVTTLAPK